MQRCLFVIFHRRIPSLSSWASHNLDPGYTIIFNGKKKKGRGELFDNIYNNNNKKPSHLTQLTLIYLLHISQKMRHSDLVLWVVRYNGWVICSRANNVQYCEFAARKPGFTLSLYQWLVTLSGASESLWNSEYQNTSLVF